MPELDKMNREYYSNNVIHSYIIYKYMTTIVKATTKGQITIPASWRKRFATNRYLVEIKNSHLEIKPLDLDKLEEKQEYTVFDAIRDNGGKGIKASDLQKILKKIV